MIDSEFESLGKAPRRAEPPFEPLDGNLVKTLEKAICLAWHWLKESQIIDLSTAAETDITTKLQASIIDVLNSGKVEGFVSEIFQNPVRDGSICSYDNKLNGKQPDLAFYIAPAKPLHQDKGFFYECKPIGNIATYFGVDGLGRFCDGRYAWAMPHAGMIAYVQRKTSPLTAEDALENHVEGQPLTIDAKFEDKDVTFHSIWVSVHPRSYPMANGKPPGPISIRHLWLPS
jgi:hypothetical protein